MTGVSREAVEDASQAGGIAPSAALWVNGVRYMADGGSVSARDRGLTLADGLFETMRAERGVVFRLDRHMARLASGLVRLEIPQPEALAAVVSAAVVETGLQEASVRLTVTRGPGAGGVLPPKDASPTVILAVSPVPVLAASLYEVGLTASVASGRRNEFAMTAGLKTLAYTDAVAALLEARRAGAEEALLLDTQGHCSEATASNLFMRTGRSLVTPPVTCGALPGITRAAVIELAEGQGLEVIERSFVPEDLLAADEAFLTSSLRRVAPLVRVGGRAIGDGRPGEVTHRLAEAYRHLVSHECGGS